MLPKTSGCVKSCDHETRWMFFLIEHDQFLKKYNDTWNKVSYSLKRNLILNPSTILKKLSKNQNKILW